ncbi:hypothetical protein CALVIDRAFT_533753 [Calocera viscosa TUFC12733]|uniref:Uncharacterized protein n=1 Tax=Calocera viscosa (strain TUFC12733) TaxID=1330018 RepID=A0A167QNF2_CALVF|nr:hypothetical protein CALVIDRAFT_533753 [Calocera viscosa TUFC12733]
MSHPPPAHNPLFVRPTPPGSSTTPHQSGDAPQHSSPYADTVPSSDNPVSEALSHSTDAPSTIPVHAQPPRSTHMVASHLLS